MRDVFIIGSKGIPGRYGGYETFVDKLTEYHADCPDIRYHVACKNTGRGDFSYHNADCFNVSVPDIGPAQAVWYDLAAMRHCIRTIRKERLENSVVYVLACRIGPWTAAFRRQLHALGARLCINPDGHEWMRSKWPAPVQKYWKISERLMVKSADLVICDSLNIEKYIRSEYAAFHPETAYISYGAEIAVREETAYRQELDAWLTKNGTERNGYYLMVGRLVPENNFETVIREFLHAQTERKLILITNENERFRRKLEEKYRLSNDPRIVFAGPEYDQDLLLQIRQNAFAYIHGHEVGGTNPSLLEALGSTKLNLLLKVGFNEEVAEDAALYWDKSINSLSTLIAQVEKMDKESIEGYGEKAKQQIRRRYSWTLIADCYREVFVQKPDGI